MFSDNALFDPYRDVVPPELLEKHLIKEFESSDYSVTTARAAMYGSRLPFETEILKKPCAVIKGFRVDNGAGGEALAECLGHFLGRINADGVRFVSCKVHYREIRNLQLLEAAGFRLTACQQQFRFDCSGLVPPTRESGARIRLGIAADADLAAHLGRESFRSHFDRYHSDPKIDRSACDRIHEQWARNSLAGFADEVLFAEVDGEPAGFTTLKMNRELTALSSRRICDIPLVGVIPKFRGRGLQTLLLRTGLDRWRDRADWVEIATEALNLPAQRSYTALGFKITSSLFALHKHWEESRP